MYQKIKKLADEAMALQNKDHMDATLFKISVLCDLAEDQKTPEMVTSEGFEKK